MIISMKLGDGRKVRMHKTPHCEERIRLRTALSQLLGELLNARDDLKQTAKSDPSRGHKVAEVKRVTAKYKAAGIHYSLHVREHGCL